MPVLHLVLEELPEGLSLLRFYASGSLQERIVLTFSSEIELLKRVRDSEREDSPSVGCKLASVFQTEGSDPLVVCKINTMGCDRKFLSKK